MARLTLDTHFHVGELDPRVFGGFLEHLGRAVYTGVYEPGSPLADPRGFRTDVLHALRRLRMPIIRYPGGNFVSCYDWRDGVGPVDQRPVKRDSAWKSIESNRFGTDEFMAWCAALGTQPMMAVNLGTAGPDLAASLVEYCNLPAGTYDADRRAAHGHAAPYGVKLWCLGNEMDGPWQAGHVPAEVYAQRAFAASKLMKGMDKSIQTIACGSSYRGMPTYLEYDRVVLEYCWDTVDYISAHRYSANDRGDSAWFLAEGLEIERILDDYRGLLAYVAGRKRSNHRVLLSFDEWNVWYKQRGGADDWAEAPPLLEEVYNLEDALVVAQYLAAFIRNADLVKVACLAQIVNVIAPVVTRRDGLYLQMIFHPIEMIASVARGRSLRIRLDGPTYAAGQRGEAPVLDTAATFEEATGRVALIVVNRHADAALDVVLPDRRVDAVRSAAQFTGPDLKQVNSFDAPEALTPAPARTTLHDGKLTLHTPGPGLTVVEVETTGR